MAGTEYFDYVRAIKQNAMAVKVRLADREHNCDESQVARCKGTSAQQFTRWREKYTKSIVILMEQPFLAAASNPFVLPSNR